MQGPVSIKKVCSALSVKVENVAAKENKRKHLEWCSRYQDV